MIFRVILVLVYFNCVFPNVLFAADEPTVKTSSGTVKGASLRVLSQDIDQYLGIPYAEPPVGKLRFAKPKPITKPIEGVIDGTKAKHSCMQKDSIILGSGTVSEDCLNLNIWSPKNVTKLKPVMFWIYGGGLNSGSISIPIYNGSVLASHDVVVVSVNYRLGHLGFLYGGEESAPGNVGLYDQVEGLKWVRENIHLFGGDKNQITIFGESAGSWSVSTLVLSPVAKGLFKRAIMESGAQFYNKDKPVQSLEVALNNAKTFAKSLNCADEKTWLECLRKVDAKLMLKDQGLGQTFPLEGTEFLPISAQKAFAELKFNTDVDIIAGIVRNEGSILAKGMFKPVLKSTFDVKEFEVLVIFSDGFYHNVPKDKVMKYYLDKVDTKNATALIERFYDYFGDIALKCPTYHFAKQFAKHAPNRKTYFYELTYEMPIMTILGCDEKTMGICHGADIPFVFGIPLSGQLSNQNVGTDTDSLFSLKVMKMWTNFAKTGEPGENWQHMVSQNKTLVKHLDPHSLTDPLVDPFFKPCDEFWGEYYLGK